MIRQIIVPLLLAVAISAEDTPKVRILFPEHFEKASVAYETRKPDGHYIWHVGVSGADSDPNPYKLLSMPSGASFFEIPAATGRFKAMVWAPGCRVRVFDVPVESSDVELRFACDPLRNIRFVGRVKFVDNQGSATISVDYAGTCPWSTDGCGGPQFANIASANVAPDGTFNMELPDFNADPVVSGDSGSRFFFTLNEGKRFEHIKPESSEYFWVNVASSYPKEVILVPEQ